MKIHPLSHTLGITKGQRSRYSSTTRRKEIHLTENASIISFIIEMLNLNLLLKMP